MQMVQREALVFPCADSDLVGLLHRPQTTGSLGVIVVPGAPQYRVGAHRLFVTLADSIAAAGFPVLRFDPRGFGDSDGHEVHFTNMALDIEAAIATLMQRVRSCQQVVLMGLCDGATASLLGGTPAPEVRGLILMNPWLREGTTPLSTRLKHYYLPRLLSWNAWRDRLRQPKASPPPRQPSEQTRATDQFAVTALHRLATFGGASLIVLSGDDIVAREFEDCATKNLGRDGLKKIPSIELARLSGAKHTFTRSAQVKLLEKEILAWLSRFHNS